MRFVSGMAIGAGLVYLLDPQRGRGRRAVVRDKARHYVREGKDLLETGIEDLENRAQGLRARARHPFRRHKNPGQKPELLQENWSPGTRLVMGAAGLGLAIFGMARSGLLSTLAGAGLFARAAANRPLRRVIGLEKGRLIDVHKTITVHAPREEVYRFWRAFE